MWAQDPVFTARVSVNRLAQHSVFEISFELQNANGSDFIPPSFKDFSVVGGPSVGSSTMIVNGSVSRSQSWSYSLLATKQGSFVIGPASVVAGRKSLKTKPVAIEVTAAKDVAASQGSNSTGKQPILLKAETDATTYYPGQQIILTYRLLFNENIQTVSTLDEDEYTDFFIQPFSNFSREGTIENINGVLYTSRIVKSLALFAHQSGTYTIRPMVMTAGINAPFAGNQGFFAMRRLQDVQVASEPLKINILPLPPNAPDSYSGAVGKYDMQFIPGKTTLTTDEAWSCELEITGNGDARRWDVPKPVTNGRFETYDPKILTDNTADAGDVIMHTRRIAYQMIPDSVGEFVVDIPFTYFDPERKEYVTIHTDPVTLHVTQGTGIRQSISQEDQSTIPPAKLMAVHRVWLNDRFWTSWLHLVLFGLILGGTGYGFVVRQKRMKEQRLPEAERIRQAAAGQALSQWDALETSMGTLSSSQFFEKATAIYHRFLMERFAIPASELDEAGLKSHLEKAGLEQATLHRTLQLFTQSLSVRYGGIPGGYSREEMLRECRQLTGLLAR